MAPPGSRSSTTRTLSPSVTSRLHRTTRTPSGLVPVRTTIARAARGVVRRLQARPMAATAGKTWCRTQRVPSHCASIVVDPSGPRRRLCRAALGRLWGPNRERGVYKTTDGGRRTWTPVLQVDENTGATELVMDPLNNKVLYAGNVSAATHQPGASTAA